MANLEILKFGYVIVKYHQEKDKLYTYHSKPIIYVENAMYCPE